MDVSEFRAGGRVDTFIHLSVPLCLLLCISFMLLLCFTVETYDRQDNIVQCMSELKVYIVVQHHDDLYDKSSLVSIS